MTMHLQDLRDLYIQRLQAIYDGEQQGLRMTQEVSEIAQNPQFKACMQEHVELTRQHIERLEQLFAQLDLKPGDETNRAVQGLVAEAHKFVQTDLAPEVRDAALIAAHQSHEHYEIANYGTARTYAHLLGDEQAVKLLEQTLQEEKETDERLSQIAGEINVEAV